MRSPSPRLGSDVRFGGRLLFTLLLTLTAVGGVQYRLSLSDLEDSVLAQRIEVNESDAHQLVTAFRSLEAGQDRVAALETALVTVADRAGVDGALLVGGDGRVIAMSAPDLTSAAEPAAVAAGVAGRSSSRVLSAASTDGRDRIEVVVPVQLPIGTFALEVTEQATPVFDEQISTLRRRSVVVLLIGLALGLPIFYLFGGRSLSLRHRDALRRSTLDGLTGGGQPPGVPRRVPPPARLGNTTRHGTDAGRHRPRQVQGHQRPGRTPSR